MRNSNVFWDRHAHRYFKRPVPDEAIYQHKLRVTQDYLRADMHVLEIGCGTGTTAIAHAPHVRSILAVDYSTTMIEIANAEASRRKLDNIEFVCLGVDDLDQVGSFDAVLMLNVLHLLPDLDDTVSRVFRMLKPGGLFVSSTECIADYFKSFRYLAAIGSRLGLMPSVNVFSETELLAGLATTGFVLEHRWRPAKNASVFLVARRPEQPGHDMEPVA